MSPHARPGLLRGAHLLLVAALAVPLLPRAAAAQSMDRSFAIDLQGRGNGPALLAAQLPADQRDGALRMFDRVLVGYRDLERKFGLGKNDPAGAIAAFVGGNVSAYHDARMSDAAFAALVKQVQGALAANPRLAEGLQVGRASVAEQMAIVGMMMVLTQMGALQGADRDGVKAAARRYLVDHLSIRIDDVEITEAGLVWSRGRPSGPLAALVRPGPAPAPAPAPAAAVNAKGVSAAFAASTKRVEMVGFSLDTGYSWDGSVRYDFNPVVLLRSGDAVRDIGAMSDRRGLDGHRKASPAKWTKWRRAGQKIETLDGNKWEELGSLRHMQRPLPASTRLSGSFSRTSAGTTQGFSAISWSNMVFERSGRFSSGGGSGSMSRSHDGRAGVATSDKRAAGGGTYAIDGFMLTLRHDDGQVEYRSIVTHPTDGKIIWIDGAAYTRD